MKVFYPKFTDKVSRLANKTTATLEIKLQWREQEGGPLKEEVLRDNFTLLGVNEVQYSDLPNEDIATWYDSWTLAQFIVCMVTPNDPVVKEYAAVLPRFPADPDQLLQVFINLILNGIQAMTEGGTLLLRTEVEKGQIRIDIQDTGCGITQENMRKLFTPFFTTKKEVKGVIP